MWLIMPSVLWHCWLSIRKSTSSLSSDNGADSIPSNIAPCIWSVKTEWWGVGVDICLEKGTDCLHMVQLMPLHPKTTSFDASFTLRLVLPFWYWLTQVVLEKSTLNECSSTIWLNKLNRRATYCDDHVLVVFVYKHISIATYPIFTKIFAHICLRPWLDPPLAALRHLMYFRFIGWRHFGTY